MKSLFVLPFLMILSVKGQTDFITSNNLFAVSLHKEISRINTDSFLVSPLSANLILSLLQSGSRGESAKELQHCLHLPSDQEFIKSSIKTALSALPNHDEYYSLQIANKMYILENYHIKDEFSKTATEIFSSEIENVDFSKNVETTNNMNRWVEEHTNHKIHDLISSESIDDNTRLVLINALYFQAAWKDPFAYYKTESKSFYLTANEAIQVPMMTRQGFFRYSKNSELKAQFLEIPFNTKNVSMVFVLPFEKDGLSSLEKNIEKVFLPQNFTTTKVDVLLPRFKMESSVNLKNILMNLGVRTIFADADLSGISDDGLYVSEALQKTFISVKEEGVEAAAATYTVIDLRIAADSGRLDTKNFHADHPFLFYIKVNDLIIFSGRLRSPNVD